MTIKLRLLSAFNTLLKIVQQQIHNIFFVAKSLNIIRVKQNAKVIKKSLLTFVRQPKTLCVMCVLGGKHVWFQLQKQIIAKYFVVFLQYFSTFGVYKVTNNITFLCDCYYEKEPSLPVFDNESCVLSCPGFCAL